MTTKPTWAQTHRLPAAEGAELADPVTAVGAGVAAVSSLSRSGGALAEEAEASREPELEAG